MAGAVSQMATEVRIAGDWKREVRSVLKAQRWRVQHVSVDGGAQPSATVWEAVGRIGGGGACSQGKGGYKRAWLWCLIAVSFVRIWLCWSK